MKGFKEGVNPGLKDSVLEGRKKTSILAGHQNDLQNDVAK